MSEKIDRVNGAKMKMSSGFQSFQVLLMIFFFLLPTGCALFKKEPLPPAVLEKVSFSSELNFSDDLNYDGLSDSILQSLSYLKKIPPDRVFQFGSDSYTGAHMVQTLTHFLAFIQTRPSTRDLNEFIKTHYLLYRSIGAEDTGKVLFTGYYEPTLRGSLTKSDEYRFPIYSRPKDLLSIDLSLFSPRFKNEKIWGRITGQTVIPYFDRKEIEANGLSPDMAETLFWVDDPIALFFLHIQGSGKIILDDGQTAQVHYHASNGQPYRSIGKILIDEGKIEKEKMSMQAIRRYLKENPAEIDTVLNYNPSYIFFKIETEGPLGCLNVPLTPGRSLALDRRLFPPAALTFIETKLPLVDISGQIQEWMDCTRFVLNQDTGGAIRGPGRADLFWGDGPYAETAAGFMQHSGNLFFLVLKPELTSAGVVLDSSGQNK